MSLRLLCKMKHQGFLIARRRRIIRCSELGRMMSHGGADATMTSDDTQRTSSFSALRIVDGLIFCSNE